MPGFFPHLSSFRFFQFLLVFFSFFQLLWYTNFLTNFLTNFYFSEDFFDNVPGLRFSKVQRFFLYKSKTQLAAIFLFIDHLLLGNSKEKLLKVSRIQKFCTFRNLNFYLASALQFRFSQQHGHKIQIITTSSWKHKIINARF